MSGRRRLYLAQCWIAGTSAAFAFATGLIAALLQSGRAGGVCAVFTLTAFLAMFALGFWWIDGSIPPAEPKVSRGTKRRLREEQERINFEAEIRRMEREAGL